MNMKNKIGVCATLLTALLCAVPQSAQATGKIRAVDVYDPSDARTFPNPGDALKVGDEVYIRFRLVNLMWRATQDDHSFVNPWFFVFPESALTGNETLDQLQQLAANKPRLGLWVNGEVREAECVNFPLGVASAASRPVDQRRTPGGGVHQRAGRRLGLAFRCFGGPEALHGPHLQVHG